MALRNNFDVTTNPTSIAAKVEPLIGTMNKMTLEQIKESFAVVLYDPETTVSNQTRNKWINVLNDNKNKTSLMFAISNLYLAAARLKTN
jgi:hypothetical protein